MDYKQTFARKKASEEKIAKYFGEIKQTSGIYVFARIDTDFKYAYVGQAVNLKQRTAEHLLGYQHIDLSIKKRGFFTAENLNGWKLIILAECDKSELDSKEQEYIKKYADGGFQVYNKTTGGQLEGKSGMQDTAKKGYLQGKNDGYEKAIKEIGEQVAKYTNGLESKSGAVAQRKTEELIKLLKLFKEIEL